MTRLTAIGFLIAAGFVFSAGRADAGCGDYLTIRNADGSVADASHTPTPGTPGVPCHGPNCSATPHPLPAAPVTIPTDTRGGAKEWAAGFTLPDTSGASFASALPVLRCGQPVHRPSEPFIPPRSV